jgi:hypothetical protein
VRVQRGALSSDRPLANARLGARSVECRPAQCPVDRHTGGVWLLQADDSGVPQRRPGRGPLDHRLAVLVPRSCDLDARRHGRRPLDSATAPAGRRSPVRVCPAVARGHRGPALRPGGRRHRPGLARALLDAGRRLVLRARMGRSAGHDAAWPVDRARVIRPVAARVLR